jgi:hypothetical protein
MSARAATKRHSSVDTDPVDSTTALVVVTSLVTSGAAAAAWDVTSGVIRLPRPALLPSLAGIGSAISTSFGEEAVATLATGCSVTCDLTWDSRLGGGALTFFAGILVTGVAAVVVAADCSATLADVLADTGSITAGGASSGATCVGTAVAALCATTLSSAPRGMKAAITVA